MVYTSVKIVSTISVFVVVVSGVFYTYILSLPDTVYTVSRQPMPERKERKYSRLEEDRKFQELVEDTDHKNKEPLVIDKQKYEHAERPYILDKHIEGREAPPVGDQIVEHLNASIVNKTVERQNALVDIKKSKTSNGAPILHVALLKLHKCGSGTVQNVFLRIGEANNATFVFGKVTSGGGCGSAPHCISYTESVNDDNIVPPPPGSHFDILCCDVRYHRQQWRKYLPNDTVNIGLVRDPVQRLESAINFYKSLRNINMSSFAKKPDYQNSLLNNRIAYEFGFKQDWLPKRQDDETERSSAVNINRYMDDIMPDFDIIMVNERLDESFVLLKRRLRWKTQDVVYAKQHVRHHDSLSGQERDRMKMFLYLDYRVYNHALHKLDKMISEAGAEFLDEVKDFQEVRQAVNDFCTRNVESSDAAFTIRESKWHDEFIVTKSYCDNLLRDEIKYVNRLRIKQYGTFRKT